MTAANFLSPRRFVALAAASVLVSAGCVLGFAGPASAHNYLVSSTPAEGETLTELPEVFEITTNEALLATAGTGSFALEVTDEAGLYYGTGCVEVAGPNMTTPAVLGEAGDYTALWQVVSADGHTVSGSIPFTWEPTAEFTAAEGSETAPVCADDSAAGSSESEVPAAESEQPAQSVDTTDLLWIGGAVVLVGLAIGITLFLTGRKKK